MRIGLLTTSFPRWEGDTAGLFVLGFARALSARGHELHVLAPEPRAPLRQPRWPAIEVTWVPYLRPRSLERTFYGAGAPDNLAQDPRAWLGVAPFPAALFHAARRHAPRWDAVVSHWALPCALVAGWLKRDRPHLAVLHSGDVHALARLPGGRALARKVPRSADALLFASSSIRERFLELLPPVLRADANGKSHVSPMGVDVPTPLSEPRKSLRRRLDLNRFTVLSLSRLVSIKGLDDAIRAVAGQSRIELVVGGRGPEEKRLRGLAHELRAPVRFVGTVTGRAKDEWLRAADAFVVPSRPTHSGRDEGTPTAALEALALGLPLLATETGGLRTLITHERTGMLIRPRDAASMRQALERLASDRNLRRRLGRAGQTLGRRFTWPELAPHIEELLQTR